jgi:outer membrane lipoprotein SlyB
MAISLYALWPLAKETYMSDNTASSPASSNASRNFGLIGGGVGLLGIGLAAGMFLRTPSAPVVPAVEQAASVAQAASAAQASSSPAVAQESVAQPEADKVAHRRAPAHVASSEHKSAHKSESRAEPEYTPSAAPAVVCSTCGVVSSVRAVQQQGQGSGLGVVAGGVLGGVVGNQMGKGQGKTAMTVLGALGGGLAGNEVEKRQRTVTVYEVQIRMDDGSVRTFTQQTQPAVGARVETDGETFHVVGGAGN